MKQSEWDYHFQKFWSDFKPQQVLVITRVKLIFVGVVILFFAYLITLLKLQNTPEKWKERAINERFYGKFVEKKHSGTRDGYYYIFNHGTFSDKILRSEHLNQDFYDNLVIGDSVATFKGDSIITVFRNGEKIIYPKLNSD